LLCVYRGVCRRLYLFFFNDILQMIPFFDSFLPSSFLFPLLQQAADKAKKLLKEFSPQELEKLNAFWCAGGEAQGMHFL
jgi:hypothetical protein